MGNSVFANRREIACKSGAGKVIAAFPDVCFTPPQTPATPPGVPVPYPSNSRSSATAKGSRSVRIDRKEVMLRNISFYKKCNGDEAGCAPKKGLITSSNTSKTYFRAWSMNIKIEGENVVRHLDLTTSNHRSEVGNASVPMIDTERMGFTDLPKCKGVDKKFELVPYKSHDPGPPKAKKKTLTCGRATPPMTGHHLIPGRCMRTRTRGSRGRKLKNPTYPKGCSHDSAPCVCVDNENQHDGLHRDCHAVFDPIEHKLAQKPPKGQITYRQARNAAAKSAAGINGGKQPTKRQLDCIKAQLDNYYKNCLKGKNGKVDMDAKLNAQQDAAGLVLPNYKSVPSKSM
ncbi:DUF4150 domain-containing protein [Falsiroseomonas sp.]|uniref:DUF4150 domain-containing protein n=1 Tax=Falsiroseomonas sp. TaxID=2870721 RepID=UPI0035684290